MSEELVMLKPARPGLVVRDPVTLEPLRADGQLKPLTTYWVRRKRDKDVVVVPVLAPKKTETKAKKATAES